MRSSVDLGVAVAAFTPPVDERADGVPVCVASGRERLADAGGSEADADGALFADGLSELRESAVFLDDDELAGHGLSSS